MGRVPSSSKDAKGVYGKSCTEMMDLGDGPKSWMLLNPICSGTDPAMNAWNSFSVT